MTIIGITMGCPVGIGPEIICKYFSRKPLHQEMLIPVVIGDTDVLKRCRDELSLNLEPISWDQGQDIKTGQIPVINITNLNAAKLQWGAPDSSTGKAAGSYVQKGIKLIQQGLLDGITTCPLNKESLNQGGFQFPGHTEMLARLTNSDHYAMMLAGKTLKVTLVTIHCPFKEVVQKLNQEAIVQLIHLTHKGLKIDLGIQDPKIAVAALNPHAGEHGLFGDEEEQIITPAVIEAADENIDVHGPFPPDTIFVKAATGEYDAVVCMYHDQGLIPFKLLHFSDGVNVTLGLPIVRTSVDHGTAYDIAGRGMADPESLICAIRLAKTIAENRLKSI